MPSTETLSLSAIANLANAALRANGFADDHAASITDVVVRAEADGCRSHGLYRIDGYVSGVRAGRVNPTPKPQVRRLKPALLTVDGDGGYAPLASDAARPVLIEAARENGIAALALTHAHHLSALWADLEPLAEAGLVAWCFVVGQSAVAPHGGQARLMGTNPIGFAWPRPGGDPFLFDFATSAAARGEVELKRLAGEPLPEGWAIDPQGNPTTDPAAALAGALLPFGGHKGSALSMMVELIAGPLIGEMTSRQAAALGHTDSSAPPGGQLYLVFDPSSVSPSALADSERFFDDALAQEGVRLPSQRRYAARRETQTRGVEVPSALLAHLRALAQG